MYCIYAASSDDDDEDIFSDDHTDSESGDNEHVCKLRRDNGSWAYLVFLCSCSIVMKPRRSLRLAADK